ncbi:MAG: DUF5685 family protein [Eubacteriales bacterium]|nr:DUF5685 family protein [Eubacteriales bacterium]MDD3199918.1 DUF5685 family protein [Eubacteriales bacterium]MDD4630427.1 DUF5685 family protein [Eubacteriales bacterium]
MLGYVKPDKPELKIKEYEIYSGYYCGICKSIARRYGQIPRIVLNYDSVFLAIMIAGIQPSKEHIKTERCLIHPLKKRTIIYDSHEIDYAADILLLLAYYKLKDDCLDDKSKKAAIGAILLKGTFKRLTGTIPEKCDYVRDQLNNLALLEEAKCPSIDRSAEPFAKLTEEVFDYPGLGLSKEKENPKDRLELPPIFRRIGYHIGKWIYLIDAYDDIDENLKNSSFNPLILQFEYNADNETVNEFKERIRERVERNLILYLAEIAKCCGQLNFEKNRGLIENILYLGLMRKTEEVLKKGTKNNAESI